MNPQNFIKKANQNLSLLSTEWINLSPVLIRNYLMDTCGPEWPKITRHLGLLLSQTRFLQRLSTAIQTASPLQSLGLQEDEKDTLSVHLSEEEIQATLAICVLLVQPDSESIAKPPHAHKQAEKPFPWRKAGWVGFSCFVLIIGFFGMLGHQSQQVNESTDAISPAATQGPSEIDLKAKQMELEIERLKLEQAKLKAQQSQKSVAAANAPPAINITESELRNLDCRSLWILRNTIFARYGRVFSDPEIRSYFNQQDWYQPSSNYHDGLLTASEKASAAKILAVEQQFGCL